MSGFRDSDNEEVEASDIEDENEVPQVKIELHPSDFYFGNCLGEGAYARVVHARSKKTNEQFAIKIMEKVHIKRENKVSRMSSWCLTTTSNKVMDNFCGAISEG